MSSPTVVDIDDVETWPSHLREVVEEVSADLADSSEYFADLDVPLEQEHSFRDLTHGYVFRAYHATRLLHHEIEAIGATGLAPLTQKLIDQRLMDAVRLQELPSDIAATLNRDNALRGPPLGLRSDQVCLFLSRAGIRYDVRELWNFMRIWGGEGINFTNAGSQHVDALRIGKPAIVVALVDLSDREVSQCHPELLHVMVGKRLGFDQPDSSFGAAIHYMGPIPAERIEDIWTPGTSNYAEFPELPLS